jgi:hypothetical protein
MSSQQMKCPWCGKTFNQIWFRVCSGECNKDYQRAAYRLGVKMFDSLDMPAKYAPDLGEDTRGLHVVVFESRGGGWSFLIEARAIGTEYSPDRFRTSADARKVAELAAKRTAEALAAAGAA